jgi:hypothetical protein
MFKRLLGASYRWIILHNSAHHLSECHWTIAGTLVARHSHSILSYNSHGMSHRSILNHIGVFLVYSRDRRASRYGSRLYTTLSDGIFRGRWTWCGIGELGDVARHGRTRRHRLPRIERRTACLQDENSLPSS